MDPVATIMVQDWAYVPAIHTMGFPAGALVRFLVGNNPGAWCCHGGTVEIIMAIKLGIRIQTEIDPLFHNKVECYSGIWQELVPESYSIRGKMGST
jgi:hypothetical protein